jgi:thiol-disulfide isomerase/thioredoxin
MMKHLLSLCLLFWNWSLFAQNLPTAQLKLISGASGVSFNEVLKKSPYTLVSCWASWCEDCKGEFGTLEKFAAANKGKLQIVSVSIDSKEDRLVKTARKYNVNFPIFWDAEKKFLTGLGFSGVPANILLNKDGKVIKKMTVLNLQDMSEGMK